MENNEDWIRRELIASSNRLERIAVRRARRQRTADRLHRDLLQKQKFGTALVLIGPLVVILALMIPAEGGAMPYLFGFATSLVGAVYRDRIQSRIKRARTVYPKRN